MTKAQLIYHIYKAFDGVTLEDGIGLLEAQGHDDYASAEVCARLREKDETQDWKKIPLLQLHQCASSTSFFDAKGMRFHLPILLLFHLDVFSNEEELLSDSKQLDGCIAPDIEFHLALGAQYKKEDNAVFLANREETFSLLNTAQIQVVIEVLKYTYALREKENNVYGSGKKESEEEQEKEQQQDVLNWWYIKLKHEETTNR